MTIHWTRTALDARLEALERRHEGQELIDAVVSFADTLTDEDRRVLQDVLLARARRSRQLGLEAAYWSDDVRRRFFEQPRARKRRRPPE
jgi:hypothetical protein